MKTFGILSDRRYQLAAKFPIVKAFLFFLPLCALFLYKVRLLEDNSYAGFIDVHIDAIFICIYFIWVAIIVSNYPMSANCPSDVFLALYLTTVALCGSVFWGSTGLLDASGALLLLTLITLPILMLKIARGGLLVFFKKHLVGLNFFPEYLLAPTLISVLVFSGVVGYLVGANEGGFDIASMYERRMVGRENFVDYSLQAYLMTMSVNAVAPLLAFIAAQEKKIAYAAIAVAFSIFGFWLLGLKAPLLYVVAMYAMGYSVRNGLFKKIPKYIIFGLAFIFSAAIFEIIVFDYSFIADYFIRRTFLVGSQIQTYFVDKIFFQSSVENILFGVNLNGLNAPSLLIGQEYFDIDATNANTNAFLYSLALSGLFGYFLSIIFVCLFMAFVDYLYIFKRRGEVFAVAVIYSVLILEQAYTTAFISSGVMLCLFLVLLFSKKQQTIKIIKSKKYENMKI